MNDSTSPRGIFMPHPRRRNGDVPGRYPLQATVQALTPQGTKCTETILVHGDAYSLNQIGPNMDPCVFSDPLPWIWSYCRMSSSGGAVWGGNYIMDATDGVPWKTGRLLNRELRVNDIVFFGSFENNGKIWIDTVLVVGEKKRWKVTPLKGKASVLTDPPKQVEKNSDVWRFHFEDHLHNHRKIYVETPYYSIFGSMYEQTQRSYEYSYIPWVDNDTLFCLSGPDLSQYPGKILHDLLVQSRQKVASVRPLLFNYDLAKALWDYLWSRSNLRVVSAIASTEVKSFEHVLRS